MPTSHFYMANEACIITILRRKIDELSAVKREESCIYCTILKKYTICYTSLPFTIGILFILPRVEASAVEIDQTDQDFSHSNRHLHSLELVLCHEGSSTFYRLCFREVFSYIFLFKSS